MDLILTKDALAHLLAKTQNVEEIWEEAVKLGLGINSGKDLTDEKLFAKVYLAKRRTLHHKGLSLIKPGSKQWHVIEKVTIDAQAFCYQYELPRFEGFVKYVEAAEKIDKLSVQSIIFAGDDIALAHSVFTKLDDTKLAAAMGSLLYHFENHHFQTYGRLPEIDKLIDYERLFRAVDLCKEHNIQFEEFIKLMAEQWAWTREELGTHQLVGKKARKILKEWQNETLGPPVENKKVVKVSLKKGHERYD